MIAFQNRVVLSAAIGLGLAIAATSAARAGLLVGNTEANNIVIFDERTGRFGGEFIPAKGAFYELNSPDDLTFGQDGNLYISVGDNTSGAILRFDGTTGEFIDRFDQGGMLMRPYGTAFGPDGNLYVSSFRSDEILRYSGTTGEFLDVFAAGTGTANGLNGPNDLLFADNGDLYVTTQGSVADGTGEISYQFASQILRYNIFAPEQGAIVFDEPDVAPNSTGFVSLLGLTFGTQNDLIVSDFANAIRRYDLATGDLLTEVSSSYPGFMGNVAINPDGNIYTPGFDFLNKNIGGVSRFDADGNPLPATDESGSIFIPATNNLKRPIGIAYTPAQVPEPSIVFGLVGAAALGWKVRRKRVS
ncbi:PEP-CTERM sorting domain-containing protein [Microcoleus sp. FACHB-1515]|uniref:Vgb family protein n=1 Tax=Cyanophyceae TaxID=3028117 RepID=UPI001683E553|nr:PEP-CTERM sorting domain-containing protein [Microcoleus sp. FACHB-1515]MBD2091349.1 PEP-CTERM sorting domain-containing protein [Microcoleus sp. FACHB-1515]